MKKEKYFDEDGMPLITEDMFLTEIRARKGAAGINVNSPREAAYVIKISAHMSIFEALECYQVTKDPAFALYAAGFMLIFDQKKMAAAEDPGTVYLRCRSQCPELQLLRDYLICRMAERAGIDVGEMADRTLSQNATYMEALAKK